MHDATHGPSAHLGRRSVTPNKNRFKQRSPHLTSQTHAGKREWCVVVAVAAAVVVVVYTVSVGLITNH